MFSQSSKALKFVQKENFLGNAFMVMQHSCGYQFMFVSSHIPALANVR